MTVQLIHFIAPVGVWSANLYQRCAHQCQYCIAGSGGESTPWYASDAEALIAMLPDGAGIQFAPLDLRHCGGTISLLGRRYSQAEILEAYQRERARIGESERVIWKAPLP